MAKLHVEIRFELQAVESSLKCDATKLNRGCILSLAKKKLLFIPLSHKIWMLTSAEYFDGLLVLLKTYCKLRKLERWQEMINSWHYKNTIIMYLIRNALSCTRQVFLYLISNIYKFNWYIITIINYCHFSIYMLFKIVIATKMKEVHH